MYLEDLIAKLKEFWKNNSCVVLEPWDMEVGAGTFHPATFLRSLGPEPWAACYVQPSRRPTDGRYGENPNRVQHFYQFQVLIKPSPDNIQDMYIKSLEYLGFNRDKHDLRFVEDDWESPTLGAWGLGWEVWIDGMEVTQFTYFQQVGGLNLSPISVEITYGLERIAMYLQNCNNIFDIKWNKTLSYGDLFLHSEKEQCAFNFQYAPTDELFQLFEIHSNIFTKVIDKGIVYSAYEQVAKCSHIFNLLDARGAISVTQRAVYIKRIRDLSSEVARSYVKIREEMGFPLIVKNDEGEEI